VSEVWSREVKAHTGYLPENIAFYDHLTGLETLTFYASLKGAPRSEIADMLDLTGISHAAERKVGGYSKGMRQRLGLAQSLLGSPKILFLDEPTTGLDPEGIGAFYNILNDVKERGVTIVLTSHILKEIQDRVDRLGIIGDGKLLASGSVKELRSDLGLSPTLRLTVKGNAEGLRDAALKAGGDIQSFEGGMLVINCPHGNKMELLRALMKEDDSITDLELVEPSLEDVFMGYAAGGEV
jgi:Cu-processing system ATP-binding protein